MGIAAKDCAEFNFEVKLFGPTSKELGKVQNIHLPALANIPSLYLHQLPKSCQSPSAHLASQCTVSRLPVECPQLVSHHTLKLWMPTGRDWRMRSPFMQPKLELIRARYLRLTSNQKLRKSKH